jgi:choline dehydrogenase-like flavoprotein
VDFQPCLVDVKSRGRVQLASADPSANPIIDPNYLSEPRELEVLVKAIRFARSLAGTDAFKEFGLKKEILPGRDVDSDTELAEYVRNRIETCFHPAGTCRMGMDNLSVVDPNLRVHALDGLRVADASVMPSLINGNTNGPTIMIAEKAADLIGAEY